MLSCGKSQNAKDKMQNNIELSEKKLINHVKLAINPIFQDWVLFKNGTYIIFDNADTISDIKAEAIKSMKKYGPVYPGSQAGDFGVISLKKTEGWIVTGHGYGMYTYVNPIELKSEKLTDSEIGLFGRKKRELDGKLPTIIFTNRKKK